MQYHRGFLRLALAAVAFSVPVYSATGQGQIGAVVGATFSTLRGIDGVDSRTGVMGGLSLVFAGAGPLALQTGALFVSKGAEADIGNGLEIDYLEVPVVLRLGLSRGMAITPHIYAGPYFGFELDCKVEGTSADCDDAPGVSTKSVDIGGIVGGGLDFGLGPFILTGGVRYGFGVSKVADFELGSVRESAKNGTFAIYAGLGIKFGG